MAEDRKRLFVRFVKPGDSNASGKLAFEVQQKRFTPAVLTEFQLRELDIEQRTRAYLRTLAETGEEAKKRLTGTDADDEIVRTTKEAAIRGTNAMRIANVFELVRETLDLDSIATGQHRQWIESDVSSDEFWSVQDVDECERALYSFRHLLGIATQGAR